MRQPDRRRGNHPVNAITQPLLGQPAPKPSRRAQPERTMHRWKPVMKGVGLAKRDIKAPNVFSRLLVAIKAMLHPCTRNPITGRAGC